ncbi:MULTISPECIES: peroxiredoxin-like family protein, partial [Bosea]|uniref:peroxiredoxin-like family protein n=1 Tax=Bosea TaxID=85413 RepID=UPI00286CB238
RFKTLSVWLSILTVLNDLHHPAQGGLRRTRTIVSLSSLLARGPLVVTFYRGGWCPYCNLQLLAYQQVLPTIRELGAELVAISPQQPDHSERTAQAARLDFPVLSDVGNVAAAAYGLAFELPSSLRAAYESAGTPVQLNNGDETWRLPVPGTFVVAQSGLVVLSYVDADYRKRLEPTEILGALTDLRDEIQIGDPAGKSA